MENTIVKSKHHIKNLVRELYVPVNIYPTQTLTGFFNKFLKENDILLRLGYPKVPVN